MGNKFRLCTSCNTRHKAPTGARCDRIRNSPNEINDSSSVEPTPTTEFDQVGVTTKSVEILRTANLLDIEYLSLASRQDLQAMGLPLGDVFRIEKICSRYIKAENMPVADDKIASNVCLPVLDSLLKRDAKDDQDAYSVDDVSVANKNATKGRCLDQALQIVEFVEPLVAFDSHESSLLTSSDGSHIVVQKERKVKLSDISLDQWMCGAVGILKAFISDHDMGKDEILNYLDYLIKVSKFTQRFDFDGIKLYDKEYRSLQHSKHFMWNSEENCGYLASLYLVPKSSYKSKKSASASSSYQNNRKPPRFRAKQTCNKFNSKTGCDFQDCKYPHICSEPNCDEPHPVYQHPLPQPKN